MTQWRTPGFKAEAILERSNLGSFTMLLGVKSEPDGPGSSLKVTDCLQDRHSTDRKCHCRINRPETGTPSRNH
eukprot:363590-Chlamydomonas_euryale.AAC.5